jgi:imidazolonepropionase-like amidohydrolase
VTARLVLAALALALLLVGCGSTGPPRGDLLITADRLFDGTRFDEPGALLVRAGRVVAVGRTLEARATKTLRYGDATIMPGVIDLHVHGWGGLVGTGVTTVRDLGEPELYLDPPGRRDGVRVLMAGPLISVADGYPEISWGPAIARDVRSPADARAAVDELVSRGAAVIKIALTSNNGQWPMLSVAETRAIVAEAHAHGRRVVSHTIGADGVATALAAHVDELAHAPCGATEAELRTLAARRVPVVATLHVLQAFGGCEGVARRYHELGGGLLYGTDRGNRGIPVGIDVEELRLLEGVGLTPTEVLAAATSEAGRDLGLAPLGSLVSGAPADAIVVRGDARRLHDDLARPLVVVAAGTVQR